MSFTNPAPSIDILIDSTVWYNFVWCGSTMSDSEGNLLFFTNGYKVFDKKGQLMPNGSGLNENSYTQEWQGLNPLLQGAISLQHPGSDNIYYIIHHTLEDSCGNHVNDMSCVLFYSVVDMEKNNNNGDLISKNNVLMYGPMLSAGQLTACRHANGRDWWIIKNGYVEPHYHKFLLTPSGITYKEYQVIGDSSSIYQFGGTSVFSSDGTRFACGKEYSKATLMDFNRCTGEFSNSFSLNTISSEYTNNNGFTTYGSDGVAFSPSGRYLYVHSQSDLYQYDLLSDDVPSTELKVFQTQLTNGDILVSHYQFKPMQLAPNGKIYLAPYNPLPYLSVINEPDSPGLACNFEPYSFPLPHYPNSATGWGMPLFPNFRLGASPVYQMQAGANRTICKDSTTQLGSAQKVNALIYNWRSTDPAAYISDVHSHNPTVSTTADEALFIVDVVDTVSRLTCLERSDTVVVKTYTCYPNQLNIPTIIKSGNYPYLVIPNLAVGTQVSVYNVAGQLMYQSADYQNNWDARIVANGVYVVTTRMSNGHRQNGKVVVVE